MMRVRATLVERFDAVFDLLHSLPPTAWLWWAAGTFPFAGAILKFVAHVASGQPTQDRLLVYSLIAAVLYFWMCFCQAQFCLAMRSILAARPQTPHTSLALLATQVIVQATALVFVPLGYASFVAAPFITAFYNSAAAFPYNERVPTVRGVVAYAASESFRRPIEQVLESLLLAFIALAALLNVVVVLIGGPILFRSLTGQETDFSRSPAAMLNQVTTFAIILCTWLIMDPICKALFTTRSFSHDAEATGVDLLATLHRLKPALVAVLLLLMAPVFTHAAAIDPRNLDRAITEVAKRPVYVQAFPPEVRPKSKNAFVRFTEDVVQSISSQVNAIGDSFRRLLRLLFRRMRNNQSPDDVSSAGSQGSVKEALIVIIVLLTVIIGWIAYRQRRYWKKNAARPLTPSATPVDLTADDVHAGQLPGDEWLAMAADLERRGELRLAARALYLAMLAELGARGSITLHRARTNLQYERELMRKTRGNELLHQQFRRVIGMFERTWYGGHALTGSTLSDLQSDVQATRTHA